MINFYPSYCFGRREDVASGSKFPFLYEKKLKNDNFVNNFELQMYKFDTLKNVIS
jgi:hypothetical protein